MMTLDGGNMSMKPEPTAGPLAYVLLILCFYGFIRLVWDVIDWLPL